MALYVCDECGCVENTALGHYWGRTILEFMDEKKNYKSLCSACAPATFLDGSATEWGKWHNQFPKRKWDGHTPVMNRSAKK